MNNIIVKKFEKQPDNSWKSTIIAYTDKSQEQQIWNYYNSLLISEIKDTLFFTIEYA